MAKRRANQERTEAPPLVVCCRRVDDPHEWNDNEIASCCRCGVEVVHRPHVPRPCEFVCIPCWLVEVQPDDEIGITPETAHEFAQWLASTLRGRHQ